MKRFLAMALVVLSCAAQSAGAAETDGLVTRDGVDIHYTIVGDAGRYLLILSGGPGEEISSMKEVADHFKKTYRCIMLEQRGTGRSQLTRYDPSTINFNAYIEDIEALRKHLGAAKLTILGNSWGMMLALAYGGAYPSSVDAIITIGSGPITRDYLQVFVDNQRMRLWPSDLEVIAYWSDPAHHAANPERAEFERIRATAPAYFYDRKASFQYAMELTPADFNPRLVPAFIQAEGAFDLRAAIEGHHRTCAAVAGAAGSRRRGEYLRGPSADQEFRSHVH